MFQRSEKPRLRDSVAVFVRGVAVSVEVFLHKRFGARYLGQYAAVGFLGIVLFGVFARANQRGPLIWFGLAFLYAWLCAQVDAWRRFCRGDNEHSRYSGLPWMLRREMAHQEYGV